MHPYDERLAEDFHKWAGNTRLRTLIWGKRRDGED
jgi:hypothetical protein